MILVVMFWLTGCGVFRVAVPTLLDRDPGFTFTLPRDFASDASGKNNETEGAWSDSAQNGRILIRTIRLNPPQQDIAAQTKLYGEQYLVQIEKNPDFTDTVVDKHGVIKLADHDAYEYIYTAKKAQARWRRRIIAVSPYDPALMVDMELSALAGTQDKYESPFDDMLDSWKWVDKKGASEEAGSTEKK